MFSSQLTMSTYMIIIFFCKVQVLWKVTFRWERRFKIEVGDDVHLVMIWFLTMSISSRNAWNQRKMLPPTYGWSWWIHVEFSCVGRTTWNPLNVSSSVLLRVVSIQWSGKGTVSTLILLCSTCLIRDGRRLTMLTCQCVLGTFFQKSTRYVRGRRSLPRRSKRISMTGVSSTNSVVTGTVDWK